MLTQISVTITRELVEKTLRSTKRDLFQYPCNCPIAIGIHDALKKNLSKGVDFKVLVDPWSIEIDFGKAVPVDKRVLRFPMTEYLSKWVKQFDRDFFDVFWDKSKHDEFLKNFKEFTFVMF